MTSHEAPMTWPRVSEASWHPWSSAPRRAAWRAAWAWTLLALLSGCGKTALDPALDPAQEQADGWDIRGPAAPVEPKVVALRVVPNAIRLPIDGQQTVLVEAVYEDGMSREVSSQAQAQVDRPELVSFAAGRARGLAAGAATVRLSYRGQSASLSVTVEPRRIVNLSLSPAQGVMPPGGRLDFQAQGVFDDGTSSEVTGVVSWETSDELVARASNSPGQQGQIRGVALGRAQVIARAGEVWAQAPISVTEEARLTQLMIWPAQAVMWPDTSRVITLRGVYSDGGVEPVQEAVIWSVHPPELARVSLEEDAWRLRALAPGQGVVVAEHQGQRATLTLEVTQAGVAQLALEPPYASVAAPGQVRFEAWADLDDGRRVEVSALSSWSTSDATRASVEADGLARARAPGQATITASLGALRAQARLTVTGAKLVALDVEPIEPLLPVGVRVPFVAIGRFEDGTRAQVTRAAQWRSSWPAVARVLQDGQVQTRQEGDAVITASLQGLEATSSVTVAADALVSLVLDPTTMVMGPGDRGVFRAFGKLRNGLEMNLSESAAWRSTSPEVVAVSNQEGSRGQVVAGRLGGAQLWAQLGAMEAAAQARVSEDRVIALSIEPGQLTLPVGTSFPLEVVATLADGSERVVTDYATWRSSAPLLAQVRSSPGFEGRVYALSPGQPVITASYAGQQASLAITVTDATLVQIQITPTDTTLQIGDEGQFSATGIFSDGSSVYITREATWTTLDEQVARAENGPDREGFVRALAPGQTRVRARLGGVVGETSLTVLGGRLVKLELAPQALTLPVGAQRQLALRAIYEDGSTRQVTGLATWLAAPESIVQISPEGVARGVAPGLGAVEASFGGLTARADVTVSSAQLVELQITPDQVEVAVNSLLKFWATAIYSDGTRQDVTEGVQWSSSDLQVMSVTVSSRWPGIGRAQGPGQAVIYAKLQGVTAQAQVTVTQAKLLSVKLTPLELTVAPGTQLQYFAQAIFDDGTSRDVTFLSQWRAEDDRVVDVLDIWQERGRAIARRQGTSKVYALYQSVRGEATLHVTGARVTQVQVIPFTPRVNVGDELRFFATAIFSDGTSQQVTQDVIWQSDDRDVARVSNARWYEGLVTTHRPGMARILATYEGVVGQSVLTVTGLQIAQIQVTPFVQRIPRGYYLRMNATAIYTNGTSRDITELATWTSTDPSVADVHASFWVKGWALGLSPGAASIQASYQGVTGQASLQVSDATLVEVSLDPPSAQGVVGQPVSFEAQGRFSDGSTWDVTHYLTWSSSQTSIADVSNAWVSRGQATGFRPGVVTISASGSGVRGDATLTVSP